MSRRPELCCCQSQPEQSHHDPAQSRCGSDTLLPFTHCWADLYRAGLTTHPPYRGLDLGYVPNNPEKRHFWLLIACVPNRILFPMGPRHKWVHCTVNSMTFGTQPIWRQKYEMCFSGLAALHRSGLHDKEGRHNFLCESKCCSEQSFMATGSSSIPSHSLR